MPNPPFIVINFPNAEQWGLPTEETVLAYAEEIAKDTRVTRKLNPNDYILELKNVYSVVLLELRSLTEGDSHPIFAWIKQHPNIALLSPVILRASVIEGRGYLSDATITIP